MTVLLKLSVIVHIITRLMFFYNIQGNGDVVGQSAELLGGVSLEKEVAPSNETACNYKRRSTKRSLNDSSHETQPTTGTSADDCVVYRADCPSEVKLSWIEAAPFVHDTSANDENKTGILTPIIKGIFDVIVRRALGICCKNFAGKTPNVIYLNRASNRSVLQYNLLSDSADMIIPVHIDKVSYSRSLRYVKILDSPGVIVIQRFSSVSQWKVVLKAVLGTWPVAMIALLLSFVAGVVIWFLDSSHNPEQFSRTFHQGAFQGFWWAFVTMTTIGYGDKTPKSVLARSFAVLWMTIGITVCSIMTASISSALTSVKLEDYDFALTNGKRIGVLTDSVAFEDAVNLDAEIEPFEDPDEMFETLKNENGIDGILEEFFIGIESRKRKDTSQQLDITKFIRNGRGLGVAYRNSLFTHQIIPDCLSNVIKFRKKDVLQITSDYMHDSRAAEGQRFSESERDSIIVFDPHSSAFVACVIALSIFVLICFVGGALSIFVTRLLKTKKQTTQLVTAPENAKSQVVLRSYQEGENLTSIFCNEQQQTAL